MSSYMLWFAHGSIAAYDLHVQRMHWRGSRDVSKSHLFSPTNNICPVYKLGDIGRD